MNINWQEAAIAGVTAWLTLNRWIATWSKILQPIVESAENMAKDGIIDKADRKALALQALAILEKQGKVKLNIISRWVVGRLIDDLARNLPDYKISQEVKTLLDGQTNLMKPGPK